MKYDGLPPPQPVKSSKNAILINAKGVYMRHHKSGEIVLRKFGDGDSAALAPSSFGMTRSSGPVPTLNATF